MKLIHSEQHAEQTSPALESAIVALPNDADPLALPLEGVTRIDLHFPKFTDQLAQMQRSGFDVAVLRADQPLERAQRVLASYPGFGVGRYQGDAVQVAPHFAPHFAPAPAESAS